MLKKFLLKFFIRARQVVGRAAASVEKRQFLVTSAAAVVMLAVLITFWNYFIFPDAVPTRPDVTVEGSGGSAEGRGDTEDSPQPQSVADSVNSGGEEAAVLEGEKPGMLIGQAAGEVEGSTPVPDSQDKGTGKTSGEKQTAAPEEEPNLAAMVRPLGGKVVRVFGFCYSPTYDDFRHHEGIDLAVPDGTPVKAALDGTVQNVSYSDYEGYRVVVDHGAGWQTVYSHMDSVDVEKGVPVNRGTLIGRIGLPGRSEAQVGRHLHLELLHNTTAKNPMDYLDYDEITN